MNWLDKEIVLSVSGVISIIGIAVTIGVGAYVAWVKSEIERVRGELGLLREEQRHGFADIVNRLDKLDDRLYKHVDGHQHN